MIYVETSALLTWLFKEPRADEVAYWLGIDGDLVCSSLTLLETWRALRRQSHLGATGQSIEELAGKLLSVQEKWWRIGIDDDVIAGASESFKIEPVRSLDAIHLATARLLQEQRGSSVVFLALDRRVRLNAIAHWFDVAPLPTSEEWHAADRATRSPEP